MEPDSSLDLILEDLPGIGRRYEMTGTNGGRIIVVITHSGHRIVHGLNPGADQGSAVELTDQQARKLGAILGGAFFKPAVVEELEAVFGNLLIDWVTLEPASPGAGKTIGELQTLQQATERIPADRPNPVQIPALLNDEAGFAKTLLEQCPRIAPVVTEVAIEIEIERRVGRHEDHDDATRLDRAIQLRQYVPVVLDVLEYLAEIKIGQGAKPGEGGHLPGKKVSEKVAAARNAAPGTDLISPSNNHDLYSIEDLAELIDELKTVNPDVRVSVKVPVVPNIGTIGLGIAKAGAD